MHGFLKVQDRHSVRSSVPVARPEISEEEPHTARLRWHRAYIPRYYSSTPIKYRVEMQEGFGAYGLTDTDWKPVARDVIRPDVTVRDISPRKDYRFRIRAELENGEVSDPTPPIQYYRSHLPVNREPLADFKLVEYEAVFLNRPYFDHLTKYVPPRMPIVKPDMVVIDQETIELVWKPAIVAEAIKGMCNLSYTVEVRCPPSFEWRELVSGVRICSHTVTQLHPRIDYIFRIRAWNEYGCSETTLPVSLYRPQAIRPDDEDDEEFEREWQLKYGAQATDPTMTRVPAKLPIDTPKIVTQASDSIWFSWLAARIPAYATQTNISYVVEVKEPPSSAWRREATGLVDCQHVMEGLNPDKDYHIRVRAETEFGPSEPTMPIMIRGKGSRPSSRRSSMDIDDASLEGKINISCLDNLVSGVPPRMPSTRPIATNAEADKLTLKWSPCRTPSYVRASPTVTYIIEKREPPGHIWSTVAKDIKATKFDVTGLNGDQDYMFRVRAKNEFGVSEPTLPMTIYRDRDDYVPQRVRSRSSSRDSLFGARARGRSSSIDYTAGSKLNDMDRASVDRTPCEPEYAATTYDSQYGVIGGKGKISLKLRAYPLPTVHWYFNDDKLEYGDMYNTFVTPAGDVVLEIKKISPEMAGQYKCYAENASGAANKIVTFELAEPPTVLEPLQDISVKEHEPVKFTCRVDGFPNATVKWTKDRRHIAGSTHCKISNPSSEAFTLEIPNALETDAGLYACTVENLAGKVILTGRLNVEIGQMIIRGKYIEDLLDTLPATFDDVNIRATPIEERYHILEEIGRGRFGIVRRVVEMTTGRVFAANYMSFRNKSQKNYFMSEYEVLRNLSQTDGILKLYDAFETDRSLIFVTEFLSEPDLLEKVVMDGNWTETNVAVIIKKLLLLLVELEKLRVLHLDIKPGNICMTGSDLMDLKLLGFGYSRMLLQDEDITHNYGSVGYGSPEQITNDVVSTASDRWSVGVLAYLLLSGNGPFPGSSEVEILSLMSECLWTYEGRGFDNFSKDAKDFIGRLLVRDPKERMSLAECLDHPWLSTQSNAKINTEKLKQFYHAEKLQREMEKVYTTVQLQSFAKVIHGRKALYQPAVDIESGEIIFPDSDEFGNYLDEDAWYQWQLQYLDDPDSQIYPIQDERFTVRECRHAGAKKFSKVQIKDRSDRDEIEAGTGVLFRDKIQPTTFQPGEEVTLSCTVITEKKNVTPVITWYRDEQLLSDDYRSEAEFNPLTGVAKLTIVNTKDYDSAVYKCVARVKDGRVSCQARLYLGDIPSKPGRPLVMQTSGTEAFLTWNCPSSDGNSYILGYRVDYRRGKRITWEMGPYVNEEFAVVSGLDPNTSYLFRISCHNKYGTSPFSWSSLETKTLAADAPKVSVAADLLPVMQFSTFDKQQMTLPAESRRPSLSVVAEATLSEADPNETFTFSDTISKGSYGEYKSCINKTTNQQCVAKIMPYNKDAPLTVTAEFNMLHTLRQANLITVLDSYIHGDQIYVIHEYLSGMNVLEYLCLHKSYTEEKVATLVRQILDAVQFLEHYGILHLNLQPSSIAMASARRPHIKLRDFTLAQKVDRDVGMTGAPAGYPDFTCPEILKGDKTTFTADIWTIGVLAFTMLSGVSPFGGATIEETLSRILFDRYSTKELYDNVSKESVKFVCKLMARLPRNRPTVNKCLNSNWLNLNENMVNSRSSRHFKSERLRSFLTYYMSKRGNEDYKVAKVDIASLPKIVPAPQFDPILSDKIMNKFEQSEPVVTLAEVLHEEASKLPDLALLEKLVYKIGRDTESEQEEATVVDTAEVKTEIGKDLDKTAVQENIVLEEASRAESGVKAETVTKKKVIVKVKLEDEIEAVDLVVSKADGSKISETEMKEENITEAVKVEKEEQVSEIKTDEVVEKTKITDETIIQTKAEDQQAAPKVQEEKTDVHEADEDFVDAVESIAPEAKAVEEKKPEVKEAVEDFAEDDEFSEAPETNGDHVETDAAPVDKADKGDKEEMVSVVDKQTNKAIEKLAESKAEEIKDAALKEIADGTAKPESSTVAADKTDVEKSKTTEKVSDSTTVETDVVKTDANSEKKPEVVDESKTSTESKTEIISDEKVVVPESVAPEVKPTEEISEVKSESVSDEKDKASEIESKTDDKKGVPSADVVEESVKTAKSTEETANGPSDVEDKLKVATEAVEASNEIKPELKETVEKLVEKAVEEAVSVVAKTEAQITEEVKTEMKATSEAQSTEEVKTEAEATTKATPAEEVNAEVKATSEAASTEEIKAATKAQSTEELKTETESTTKTQSAEELKAEVKATSEAESTVEVQDEAATKAQPTEEVKAETESTTKVQSAEEVKVETEATTKTQSTEEVKAETEAATKIQSAEEVKAEAAIKAQPTEELKAETESTTKVQSTEEVKAETEATTKIQSLEEVKAEVKATSEVESTEEIKAEVKATSEAESTEEVKAEVKATSEAESSVEVKAEVEATTKTQSSEVSATKEEAEAQKDKTNVKDDQKKVTEQLDAESSSKIESKSNEDQLITLEAETKDKTVSVEQDKLAASNVGEEQVDVTVEKVKKHVTFQDSFDGDDSGGFSKSKFDDSESSETVKTADSESAESTKTTASENVLKVSECVSADSSAVSESISTQETSVSESVSKTESAVSEITSTEESKQESTVSESLSTSEPAVSVTSESKSMEESTVTKSETVSYDGTSKSETAVSETSSKSESLISESITTTESSSSESGVAVSQTSSKVESTSIVSEDSSISESDISKNQSEVSKTITQSVSEISETSSKSEKSTDGSVVGGEKDNTSESIEHTKDLNIIKSSETKDLDVTDSSETVSEMEVSKQVSAKQELVETSTDSKLIADTAESKLSENVVATEQATSEDLVTNVEKSSSVVESVEQSMEGGKLQVTEKKETSVVVAESQGAAGETATVVESTVVSQETSAVVEEKGIAGMASAVSEKTESSTVAVESSQEMSSSVQEMSSSVSVSKQEVSESVSSTVSEESEMTRITSVERKQTLISGSMLSESSEEVMSVTSSMVEGAITEEAITSSLETAKVTKACETVREFASNDSEIEEMKKELLEDMSVTSTDCGKFLLGSHEDLSALKDKSFIKPKSKPDEEQIEKDTSMNYLDDALMFC